MDDRLDSARKLYEGFANRDPQQILGALHGDFVGHVSAGMPLGVGGTHHGPEAMLAEVWGPMFGEYEMSVDADELLEAADGRVVVLGHYRGTRRSSGDQVDAVFAHVLRIEAGLISELTQITDTASWTPTTARA